jgi:hypothetical protein
MGMLLGQPTASPLWLAADKDQVAVSGKLHRNDAMASTASPEFEALESPTLGTLQTMPTHLRLPYAAPGAMKRIVQS